MKARNIKTEVIPNEIVRESPELIAQKFQIMSTEIDELKQKKKD